MSHDHIVECGVCGMTILDIRDCICQTLGNRIRLCAACAEQREYDRVEAARNRDY